jgi:serine/threonine-protein kinase
MMARDQIVRDKYRILRLIGEGGMGSVYEARHEVLGNHVALKFLHPEIARQPGLEQRFLQEAKLSATIANPHIARVTDVDTTDQGPYLVMELLQGEPLQGLLDREKRLGIERSVVFALQILDGLQAAHALGVVHRDLKPDNVFVTPGAGGPLLKLLDFGIAKLRATPEYQMSLTRPGAVMGTPEYMAPEQAYSADLVDQRSDLYSVGVMLFEMLSGELPANGGSPQEIAEQAIKGTTRRLADLCPLLPPGLLSAVNKALEPNPDARWADAVELMRALRPFAGTPLGGPISAAAGRATGAATPFVAVNKTPRIDEPNVELSAAARASLEVAATRMSAVPPTIPPTAGPPPAATQQAKARTASMPEMPAGSPSPNINPPQVSNPLIVPAPPRTNALAQTRRNRARLWITLAVLLLTGGGAALYLLPEYLELGPTPPPLPTRHQRPPSDTPSARGVPPPGKADVDVTPPAARPTPRAYAPPKNDGPPHERPAAPTLPPFQLPTVLPPMPTTIPTVLPTTFPFPMPPVPTGTP